MARERSDSTQRFSSRVANYIAYRPHYPGEVLECLKTDCGLGAESIIADIGSGTGMLAELFLGNGNRVLGVEPNLEMREAGERLLKAQPRFMSIAGTAEATTLGNQSVDFVTAGQAFHWFDSERCRKEFGRILRPNGWVVLVWNDRRTEASPFLMAYEQLLLAHATDYEQVNHKRIDAAVMSEFFGAEPARRIFPNYQHFDLASLRGRLLSSSYVPEAGQPGHGEMIEALGRVFESQQKAGRVTFEYDTVVYYGRCIPR
jgi:SAM-dependent methyltransferase